MGKKTRYATQAQADRRPIPEVERGRVPIAQMKPAPYNAAVRKITDRARGGLRASIHRWGLLQDIVWNRATGHIVGGHERMGVLEAAGETEADAHIVDIPDLEEEQALSVALNSPAIAGQFSDGLGSILDGVRTRYPELFDRLLFEDLVGLKQSKGDKDPDDIPPPPKIPITKTGDIWQLGWHRLLCGDARDPEQVQRLMGHQKAALVFTDPPYGVSYEGSAGQHAVMAGDELRSDHLLRDLLIPAIKNTAEAATEHAAFYIWHASATRDEFSYAMKAAGLVELQYLMWAKSGAAQSYNDYSWCHEPCFYASKAGQRPTFYGNRGEHNTVWRFAAKAPEGWAVALGPSLLVTDGLGNAIYLASRGPKGRKLREFRLEPGKLLEGPGRQPERDLLGSEPGERNDPPDPEAGRARPAGDREFEPARGSGPGPLRRFRYDADRRAGNRAPSLPDRARSRPLRRHHRQVGGPDG